MEIRFNKRKISFLVVKTVKYKRGIKKKVKDFYLSMAIFMKEFDQVQSRFSFHQKAQWRKSHFGNETKGHQIFIANIARERIVNSNFGGYFYLPILDWEKDFICL